jgi:hypothetical protein
MLERCIAQRAIRTLALLFCLLFYRVALPANAAAQAPDAGHSPGDWPYSFPLWGEKLAQRGLNFPLPFGIGLNYAYINQPIKISRVAVGVNDSEMVDLSNLLVFDDLNSKVHAMNLRVDLWVLPFLNLYAMGNWAIQSQTSVSISEPFSFDAGANQSGYGGGFGFTAAAGVWGFFGTIDLNWTWNKLQKLDQPVGTFLLTPRIGKNFGKLGGIEWIFWVGAMRQVIASETRGEIRLSDAVGGGGSSGGSFQQDLAAWYNGLPPGKQAVVGGLVSRIQGSDPVIHYDLDKAVAYPWNLLIGTEIGLTPAWRVRAEFGFIQRTQLILGLNYRFGGFVSGPGAAP